MEATENATSKRSRRRTIVFGLLLVAIVIAVPFLVGEAFVRIFLKHHVDTDILLARLRATSVKNFMQATADPDLYIELKPDLNMRVSGAMIITNANGRRIGSEPSHPADNAVRVAVVGDSSSFGWDVDYEQTYPYVFSDMMTSKTGASIDLRNYSVPTYNTKQELRLFRKRVMPFKPKLLIWHRDHNDVFPRHNLSRFLHPTFGDNPLHSALVKYVMRRVSRFHTLDQIEVDHDKHTFVDERIVAGPLYEEHVDTFRQLAADVQAADIPVVVVLYYHNATLSDDYEKSEKYLLLHKKIGDALRSMGFDVLDLYPHYQQMMRRMGWRDLKQWWLSAKDPVDHHPNPKGHFFIASVLAKHVEQTPRLLRIFKKPAGAHSGGS